MYFDEINDKTGFAEGEVFRTEQQIRDYFTEESMETMFGEGHGLTQPLLDEMADEVIEHEWHADLVKPKEDCEGTFPFISRHQPNMGELDMIYDMGYCDVEQKSITFGDDPRQDLLEHGVDEKEIGIVAPIRIGAKLLNDGYTLHEFENGRRDDGVFACKGKTKMQMPHAKYPVFEGMISIEVDPEISVEYDECDIPMDEQDESPLL